MNNAIGRVEMIEDSGSIFSTPISPKNLYFSVKLILNIGAKIGNRAHFSNNIISNHGFKIILFSNILSLRDSILGYKLSLKDLIFMV